MNKNFNESVKTYNEEIQRSCFWISFWISFFVAFSIRLHRMKKNGLL